MIELKAKFDQIGKFRPIDSLIDAECKTAHYLVGNAGDEISGGIYLPKEMNFPKEGILIKKEG